MSERKLRGFRDHLRAEVGAEVRIWGAVLFVSIVVVFLAWSYLPPPLPKVIRLGAGPAGGDYARFGEALRGEVAEHGIEVEVVTTAGSRENIQLLLDGQIDVGLVQSGNLSDDEAERLASIATVLYEPVLVVQRADSGPIEGGRIAVGVPGSGVHRLAKDLFEDRGIRDGYPPGTEFVEIGLEQAVEALQGGEVDSAVFVTSLEVPWVRTLFGDPKLRVIEFELAEAFTRHYRYLRLRVIPAGLVDLRSRIPPQNVQVIAATGSLVIRSGAHRALIPLLIESAQDQLYQGDLLADPGEFPSPHYVEAPLAEEAQQYFERGPTFFYRWLPFRYAFGASRLTFVLLPLITLLYPLFRMVVPAYHWLVERRVYRWYRVLRALEDQMDASGDVARLEGVREELELVGAEILGTRVPSRYGASLFSLRVHHKLLMDRLRGLEDGLSA